MKARRGIPLIVAGVGLFAYQALAPGVPHDRDITYRFPPAASAGSFEARWRQGAEVLGQARFAVSPGQRQSSHRLLLADGDYELEAEVPGGTEVRRRVHIDAASFTVVLE